MTIIVQSGVLRSTAPAFSLDWVDHQEIEGTASSFTFNTVGIGTASASRVVAVGLWYRQTAVGATDVTTAVTIGGVSATMARRTTVDDALLSVCEIWYASVPTGTTATVFANLGSGSAARMAVSSYRIITTTPTPADTTQDTSPGDGNPATPSITVPSGGAGFAMYGARNGTAMSSWTNATQSYEVAMAGSVAVVSSAKLTATNSIAANSNGILSALVVATWS